ncbi:prepilin-type N-terminal cleavage/methylation domain-containing protein [Clostridium perfringens]|uniref:prepilin-type N-terminal cleavage/methylation domain-containing protein n=1 Tax=Clostridium perfringens TaxID=1502 RepID=UPI0003F7FD24|nr:prepilin-type N-terminal cleavage/methylation domain-containing protein [Clostridium perfringens]EGT0696381.1 prepilin-type N-terminal cleavage/methylation domain-containing protein [Clostridium perfringens]EGT3602927.1 prepilin-type N-terminal cleavage/methylation domain-containing protein [Clostridium perfringens]EJT6477351.1 prepilin-type N-terminal cleavage/methylation domain-containing protein [Clostridium perfringens]EJT6493717.1 prepilin-type N-terminal cleavage/methylation domain-con
MSLRKQNKKKKGFTLIELIIVIAIIAILAAIAIPNFLSIQRKARVKADIASAKTIYDATSALVAEGKIVPNDTKKDGDVDPGKVAGEEIFTLNKPESGDVQGKIVASGNATDIQAGELTNYLQTIPVPKSIDGGVFVIKVSGKEESPVINVSIQANNKNYLVYPNGKGAYDLNGDGLAAPQE